jgi:hypothetical protein
LGERRLCKPEVAGSIPVVSSSRHKPLFVKWLLRRLVAGEEKLKIRTAVA